MTISPDDPEARQALREVARDVLVSDRTTAAMASATATDAGFDMSLWRQWASLGWLGLLVPERHGGAGFLPREVGVVMEEMGRTVAGGPMIASAVLAAATLGLADGNDLVGRYLPALAAGELVGTVAFPSLNDDDSWATAQHLSDTTVRVNGEVAFVLDAHVADVLLLAATNASDGEVEIFALDRANVPVDIVLDQTADATRRLCRVRLGGVELPAAAMLTRGRDATDVIAIVTDLAATALAADCAGGAQRVLELTVAYAGDRVQFDRPIGSFQAVKHKCADMYLLAEGAAAATSAALDQLADAPSGAGRAASVAKAHAGDAYVNAAHLAVLVHGAIGVTWEHDLHRFVKRAKLNRALFHSSAWHRQRVVDASLGELEPA